jgi:Zn-dependent protease with chaperone function
MALGMEKDFFDAAEIERARRYHRPRYALLLIDFVIGSGVLAALAFSWVGDRVDSAFAGVPWAARAALEAAIVLGVLEAVRLPGDFWVGHLRERRYGFSTQGAAGWLLDRTKAFAIGVVLSSGALTAFIALARALPSAWPLVAVPALALLVLALGFLAPTVFEPVFNRFRPLEDSQLAEDLRDLAAEAGVPVRDVLVSDASRRTTKHNAYVSGLGRTRRVVVFDTLLARDRPRELRLIVAHELGHRRARHVLKGTLIGMAGAAAAVICLWGVLHWDALPAPGDPRVVPFLLFAGSVLQLVVMPFGAALSRRWEREADRFSLELIRDPEAYAEAHRSLARANLADLDPPRALYLLMFSHPTPPERLATLASWAKSSPSSQSSSARERSSTPS